jgi:hypothetical protein
MGYDVKRASDISSSPRLTSRYYTAAHAFRKRKQSSPSDSKLSGIGKLRDLSEKTSRPHRRAAEFSLRE